MSEEGLAEKPMAVSSLEDKTAHLSHFIYDLDNVPQGITVWTMANSYGGTIHLCGPNGFNLLMSYTNRVTD